MRNKFIKFRSTAFEKKLLIIKAKKAGLTLSEFCRKSVFEKKITERLNEEQIDQYKTLIKFHNNFKYLSNLVKNKHPNLYEEIYKVTLLIKVELQKFK